MKYWRLIKPGEADQYIATKDDETPAACGYSDYVADEIPRLPHAFEKWSGSAFVVDAQGRERARRDQPVKGLTIGQLEELIDARIKRVSPL